MNPKLFKTPAAFRKWLAANHAKSTELWVGFYNKLIEESAHGRRMR